MQHKRPPWTLYIWLMFTWCLALPLALVSRYAHRRMGANPARASERLGHGGDNTRDKTIWLHAASLGEVKQIGPLAAYLHQTVSAKILVTTTTATGADWVAQHMPYATHRFAPIDTPGAVRRFLTGWSVEVAVFVEGDIWPRMVRALHERSVPCVLLNARHSRTRARFARIYGYLLGVFALITCRSEDVADTIVSLGVARNHVHVLPDLRLTLARLPIDANTVATLSAAIKPRPLWLAASTHLADEEPVLAAHLAVLAELPDTLCIIAPRHPSRGAPLHENCTALGLTVARRSLGQDISPQTQIYIADTLGELGALYTLAPIAFLGGSFGQEGGHTPYEAIPCNTAVLYGPNVANFAQAFAELAQAGAAQRVDTPDELSVAIVDMLQTQSGPEMASKGFMFAADKQASVDDYAELIMNVLPERSKG